MAALGAAAGAFEGDNAREEQRARRAGLGLQAASLAQQDRQFVERQKLQREQMAAAEAENSQRRSDKIDELSMHQFNADRRMKFDEKQVAIDQENELYQRGRTEQQDAWKSALDEETLRNKQMEYQTNEQLFQEAAKQRQIDDEKMANRKKIAQSAMGVAIRAIAESPNNALSPSQIEYIKKLDPETYGNLVGGYGAGVGKPAALTFKDPKTGETRDEVIDPDKQFMIYDTVYGMVVANKLTGRQEQEAQNAFNLKRDKARYDSQFERNALKAGAVELSKAGERLLNIRLGRIERERSDILKELKPEDAKVLLGDKEYQKLKDRLMQLDKDEDAAVYSAYGETTPAPSGAQGGGAGIGYTEQQINELGGLKVQALREANGDNAKALDIFKQKKKQWELSQVKKDDESGGGEGGGGE